MDDLTRRLSDALAGRYRIERELGRGGTAIVYLAEDARHRRKVAIKVLKPELAQSIGPERFLREIEIAAQLEHPHILTLIDSGSAPGGILYFVMPFVAGESLRAKITREGRLPVGEAARIFREIVDALTLAHSRGVVHRDIKPDNILLSGRHAVITDFGVAKALSAAGGGGGTTIGMTVGTPKYMAPEQAAADPGADHRIDLYAAGIVAYEMLAGAPPFVHETPQGVLAAQVMQTPDPINTRRTDTPDALAALIMRALEKSPAARWASADELLERLDAVVASIQTTPEGHTPVEMPPARTRKSRLPLLVGTGAIALAAIAVFALRGRGTSTAGGDAPSTIVVLPFENIGNAENAYFADGITQEITSQLGGVPNLGVVARTSAIQYRGSTKSATQIGDELDVAYILSGTVQWQRAAGQQDRVRITPTLIRASDGSQLWTQRYDEVLADVFKVQADVAGAVASALNLTLAAGAKRDEAPTASLEAWDLYLQANTLFWRGFDGPGFRKAAELYQRAVELDPKFAQAWGMLSQVHSQMHWFGFDTRDERMEQARVAAERAVALGPNLTDSHVALGRYYYGLRDYEKAIVEFRAAEAISPSESGVIYQTGNVLRRTGRMAEAFDTYRRGFRLDQRNATMAHSVGSTALYLRRYDEAARYLELAVLIQPEWPHPRVYAIWTRLARTGDAAAAARELSQLTASRGSEPVVATIDDLWPWWLARIVVNADSSQVRLFDRRYFGVDEVSYFLTQAEIGLLQGKQTVARAWYDSARVRLQADSTRYSAPAIRTSLLGVALAGLGRNAEAVREAVSAAEELPVNRDALWGTAIRQNLALVYARTGDKAKAIATLAELLANPGIISSALLTADPAWDRLRGEAAFQKLGRADGQTGGRAGGH